MLTAACSPSVTITYQEIATCRSVEGGYGGSAPGAEYFVFYKILSVANTGPNATVFNFGPGNLFYRADVPIPVAIPPAGVTAAPGVVVAKGTTWTGQGAKGAIGLQGPARQALLLDPSHPLIYDSDTNQIVSVVPSSFPRIDRDLCTIAELQGL